MHLANTTTTAIFNRITGFIFALLVTHFSQAQDNSPYSRYGIGDVVPNGNITTRAMGGISAAYSFDNSIKAVPISSLNIDNPASLGSLSNNSYINVLFDIGGEIDKHTLKSNNSPAKYTSNNTNISYLQFGIPIAGKKLEDKGIQWGLSFGLRPVTRINYKIEDYRRISNIDTALYTYEGNGGISQANISTGVKIKNFSFGVSTGYSFGSKDYSTKLRFLNDTIHYYSSNSAAKTRFGGVFLTIGAQYHVPTKKGNLQIGAFANLQQNLSANLDSIDETIGYDFTGGNYTIDTVSYASEISGKIIVPANYTLGFIYSQPHWLMGADFTISRWGDYKSYGKKEAATQNNWTLKIGGQYFAANEATVSNNYWKFVKYRAGFYIGPDYIKLDDKSRNQYGFSVGAGFPLTSFQRLRLGEFVTLNTGIEFNARGNTVSRSMRENIVRFNFGISMGQHWFQKRKYD